MNCRVLAAFILVVLAAATPLVAQTRPASDRPLIGVYGGSSNASVELAPECRVTMLFPSVTWYEPNDFLKARSEQAHKSGVKIYPSLAGAYDASGDKISDFAREHPQFWEKRRDGTLLDHGTQIGLSWGYPEVRAHKVRAFTDLITRTGCDGVLLDYTRFFGNHSGYSDIIVEQFRKETGRDPFKIPTDDPQWVKFRAAYVTQFVAELRASLHAVNPELKLIACVGPDPAETLRNSMQDWAGWLDQGLIDGVVTMIYRRDTNEIMREVQITRDAIAGRVMFVPMIAPEYDNLDTPLLLKEGAFKAIQAGADGVAFYHEGTLFRLKLWDTIKEISAPSVSEIRSWPVNYVLNSSFESGLESWAVGEGANVSVAADAAHTGAKALKLSFAGNASARQIIDSGFIGEANSAHVTAQVKAADLPADAKLFLELSAVYAAGPAMRFRAPIELKTSADWQPIALDLPLRGLKGLKFIMLSLNAEGKAGGECLIDDVQLNLADKTVEPGSHQITGAEKPVKPPQGVNVARGQVVRGSSFWENGNEYERAVDGNLSSENHGKGAAWHSQRPGKDQWIKIYLPQTYLVTRVRMLNSSAQSAYRTREYKIEVSTDDRQYRQIARGTLPDDGTTWTEVEIPPTPARYIRFTGITSYNLDYAVGLKEIEVY